MEFEIGFSGHPNVRSNHQRTLEITRERRLTVQGDCIVGVGADHGCSDLPDDLKRLLRSDRAVVITVGVGGEEFVISGRGHPDLPLAHGEDIVIRRSGFVCPRTLAILCDKGSDAMPRSMVSALQDPGARGTLRISVG